MGFKREDGTFDDRCLAKAAVGEPLFVLRARDALSVPTIASWLAAAIDTLTPDHLADTEACLDSFREWQEVHADVVKRPD